MAWAFTSARVRGSMKAPPPVASTPGRSLRSRAITRRSPSRNAGSPSEAKISGTVIPAAASISSSESVKGTPRSAARRLPTLDLSRPHQPDQNQRPRKPRLARRAVSLGLHAIDHHNCRTVPPELSFRNRRSRRQGPVLTSSRCGVKPARAEQAHADMSSDWWSISSSLAASAFWAWRSSPICPRRRARSRCRSSRSEPGWPARARRSAVGGARRRAARRGAARERHPVAVAEHPHRRQPPPPQPHPRCRGRRCAAGGDHRTPLGRRAATRSACCRRTHRAAARLCGARPRPRGPRADHRPARRGVPAARALFRRDPARRGRSAARATARRRSCCSRASTGCWRPARSTQARALVEAGRAGRAGALPALVRRRPAARRSRRPCAALRQNPALSPTLPARVFCLARGGDWNAAEITLTLGRRWGHRRRASRRCSRGSSIPRSSRASPSRRCPSR